MQSNSFHVWTIPVYFRSSIFWRDNKINFSVQAVLKFQQSMCDLLNQKKI